MMFARWAGLAALVVCGVFAPTAANAQRMLYPMHVERCAAGPEVESDVVIASCTFVIRARNSTHMARAVAYNNRGQRYLAANDSDKALADFSQAVRSSPQYVEAYMNRGALYVARHQYARAVVDYSDVIDLTPNEARGYNARCWARVLWNAALDLARADCDTAARLAPGDDNVLDSRGLLNLRDGRFQDAFNDYDAALRINAESAHYLYGRGIASVRLGNADQGQADITAAARLDAGTAAMYAGYGVTP
jgi:tetratricopeptide (TPR) repeat protein